MSDFLPSFEMIPTPRGPFDSFIVFYFVLLLENGKRTQRKRIQ